MKRRIKNWLIYYSARAAISLVGLVPKGWVRTVGNGIGALGGLLARREHALARRQLLSALGGGGGARAERRVTLLVRGLSSELARNAVELARLFVSQKNLPEVTIPEPSRRALDGALGEGKGVVFVTGHLGNWELMAMTLASRGYPISTVAKASYDSRFTRLIHKTRQRFGVAAIYRGDPGAPKAMLKALRHGRVLGFLIDQDTDVPSTFVPFFGRPAHTPVGPALFAVRTGAPSVVGTIRRTCHGDHVIEIERVSILDDVAGATACYTAHLEARIRRHPSQWVWFHRRWRREPRSVSP